MITNYRIRIGGLMRCCTSSVNDAMADAEVAPKEGDTLRCKWAKDDPEDLHRMIFHNGAWEWDRPRREQ